MTEQKTQTDHIGGIPNYFAPIYYYEGIEITFHNCNQKDFNVN